ncbi:MAG: tRNA (guanosine(46)-N7)-methyltransferase TrmB [Deltaproteobacteria bacterium]|nr:tRNA (guanosine(46)-N7)-methyltransferase TrmB [Deltaproteobacteria bacterium]
MARLRNSSRLRRKAATPGLDETVLVLGEQGYFALDPARLFGRRAPLEVELGAGKGDFLLTQAAVRPEHDFLAVELNEALARLLALGAWRRRLDNVRVVPADARSLIGLFLPAQAVAAYHVYFPDPWPKRRQRKRRFFTPALASGLARTLRAGGLVYYASDWREYADAMADALAAAGLVPAPEQACAGAQTGYGRKYLAEGRTLYQGVFRAPSDAPLAVAQRI